MVHGGADGEALLSPVKSWWMGGMMSGSTSSMVKAGIREERLQSHRKVMEAFPYIGQTQGGSAAKMPYGWPGVLPHGRGVFEQSWDDD